MSPAKDKDGAIAQELKRQALTLGGFLALLWGIFFLDAIFFQGQLRLWGVRPRSLNGLRGLIFSPLLHGSFQHLVANTFPLVTLGWLVMLRRTSDFWVVTVLAALVGGLGTWLIGHGNSVHIGASGLVFGYFGFLLLRGYFERSVVAIAFSIIVFMLYGSLIWGVLPNQPGISWEGHLFGFAGGVIAAKLLSRPRPKRTSLDG